MPQTKRKRRNKHRGNAAGVIEARGRTSRAVKLSPAEQKRQSREERMLRPPTWKSAATKAGLMAVLLLVLTQVGLLGSDMPIATALFFAAAALVIYTPMAYATDSWVYKRQMNKAKQAGKR